MGDTRRRRRYLLGIVLALTLAPATGRAAGIKPEARSIPNAAPGRALVRFATGTSPMQQALVHARAGVRVVRKIAGDYQLVSFPAEIPVERVLGTYRADRSVAVAEPDDLAHIALAPGDPCSTVCGSSSQYDLALTNAQAGWSVYPGRTFDAATKRTLSPVTIAILDTKIDRANPDFANAGSTSTDAASGGQLDLADARDWIDPSKQSGAAAYHGTYVAGIAAAATGNGRDVAAIGYAARVMPLTVVDGNGTADAASLADAIVYAWQRGARVINLSLGLTADSQAVHDAIVRVTTSANPALVVAAAGNNTGSSAFYPGSYREVMSVSGTGAYDNHASCANHNANVSVSAPAEKVLSLAPMPSELTAALCGTSAATPHVSALAALLFAQDPARTPADVRRIIESSADDLGAAGRDDDFGAGRINVERALRLGDGSPVTTLARASVPPATGGSATITAVATSAAGIRAAEVRVDSPTATPVSLQAADGAFGGTTESLRGTIAVPTSMPAGAHPIFVRAFDGTRWGPASTSVLIVDRTPPALANLAASKGVRATGQPVMITFSGTDNVSPVVTYAVQVFTSADHRLVFQDIRQWVAAGPISYDWMPGADVLPGSYQVKVILADRSGNQAASLADTVVA